MNQYPWDCLLSRPCRTVICLVAASLATAIAGCSSVKTQVDSGAVKARTFSFLDRGSRQTPDYAEANKQAHAMVQQAIIHNLAGKGVTYTPTAGDVTVAYLIIVGNNVATARVQAIVDQALANLPVGP
jgi:hypothetical protein